LLRGFRQFDVEGYIAEQDYGDWTSGGFGGGIGRGMIRNLGGPG